MRQFNLEIDKTSPKTSRFVVPANEHFSILVRYKNWKDSKEWLDYTLADEAGADVVKYKKELESNCVLYFCSYMSASRSLHFKSSTDSPAPRDTIQVVAIASSSQYNCYICSADYARTTGEGGGGVSEEYVDSKVQEEAVARAAADEALRAEIPTKTSELTNDSGYLTEDTTTLSVAFGGLAKKITPKDVISFSSLTWQGEKHELGSKDYGVFDGNFQLDEAFWPAKPLRGYIYFKTQLLDNGYVILKDSNNNEIVKNVQTAVIKIPNDGFLLNGIAEQTNNAQFEITDSDSLGATVYEGGFQTTFDTDKYYFITAKSKIAKTSNKLIVVVDSAVSNTFSFSLGDNSGGGRRYTIGFNTVNGVFVQSFPLDDKSYIIAESDCYYSYFNDSQLTPSTGNLHTGDWWFDLGTYKEYGDITLTNVNFIFNS